MSKNRIEHVNLRRPTDHFEALIMQLAQANEAEIGALLSNLVVEMNQSLEAWKMDRRRGLSQTEYDRIMIKLFGEGQG